MAWDGVVCPQEYGIKQSVTPVPLSTLSILLVAIVCKEDITRIAALSYGPAQTY